MATLGDAYVNIIPTTEGISGKLTEALGGPAEQAGKEAGSKAGGGLLSGIGAIVGGGAAVLAGSAAVAAGAMVAGAKGVAEYGDNIDKMSQKIGISAEEYQKWSYVMARAGTNVDVMKAGMKTLSAQAESNSEAFHKLGISQEEAAKMSQAELFQKTVETLSGMEAGAERTALASKLLGKAGSEMGPLFNEGTDAIREQMQMAEEYGMIMSDEMVAASATFQDSMETLGRTMGGLKNNLLGELLPAMTEITDGLAGIFSGNTEEGVEQISQGLQDLVGKIADAVPQVLEVGGQLIMALGQAIIEHTPELLENTASMMMDFGAKIMEAAPEMIADGIELISSLASGVLENAPTAIESAGEVLRQVIAKILEHLPQMLDSGVQLLGQVAQGILNNLPAILSAILNVITSLLAEITSHLPELLQKGIELIGQLAAGLINAIPDAVRGMGQVLEDLKTAVTSVDWGALGKAIIDGIISGLKSAGDALFGALKGLAGEALGAAKQTLGINSPSRVFRDEVGESIPEGMALGITENAGMVTDAVRSLSGGLTTEVGSAYNYGGFSINVYQSPGQSSEELVDMLENRINQRIQSKRAVFA